MARKAHRSVKRAETARPKKKVTRKKAVTPPKKRPAKMTAASSKKKTLNKAGTVSKARAKTAQRPRRLTTSARSSAVGKIVAKRRITTAEARIMADRKRAEAALASSKAAERAAGKKQNKNYEKAAGYFNNRKFSQALRWFEKVIEGPDSTLRHRAEVYIRICTERLKVTRIRLRTADDYYNYGVKLINDRELEEAERCLTKALKLSTDGDHIHYAAAAVWALRGDEDIALESLRRSIVLNDQNRLMARMDSDLSSLKNHPDWDALIFPDEPDQSDS